MQPTPTQTDAEIAELVASGATLEAFVDLDAGTITYRELAPSEPLAMDATSAPSLAEQIASGVAAGVQAATGDAPAATLEQITAAVADAIAPAQPEPVSPAAPVDEAAAPQ